MAAKSSYLEELQQRANLVDYRFVIAKKRLSLRGKLNLEILSKLRDFENLLKGKLNEKQVVKIREKYCHRKQKTFQAIECLHQNRFK